MAKILSVEITLSQMKVAEMEVRGRYARILKAFRIPVPQGAVEDGYIRDTAGVAEILKRELEVQGIRTRKVCFTIASSRIASREVQIPFMKEKHILRALEANSSEYFPVDISKYTLSYEIIKVEEKVEGDGAVRQYHLRVYASPKSISTAYQELSRVMGLQLVRLDSTGESIYRAMKQSCESGTYMVMKIEEKTTLIEIIRDGELVLQRTLNYGVDGAVDTVRAYPIFGRELDFEGAMAVLRNQKCVRNSLDPAVAQEEPEDSDPMLREGRREVTESLRYLVGNITRMMDYYISRNQDTEFAGIYCCGLGAEIRGLRELLSEEIGIRTELLEKVEDLDFSQGETFPLWVYAAAAGAAKSSLNLMEGAGRKESTSENDLKGALIVFGAGAVGAILLVAGGVGIRVMSERDAAYLERRIDEESSIEEIYQTYNQVKKRYENFQIMYQYTNTPNEQLAEFMEEMEQKMPTGFTVEAFSSTGREVSFSARVPGKSEAANTLIQLRTFESLSDVTATGIEEDENGVLRMSVTCIYAEPSLLEDQQ